MGWQKASGYNLRALVEADIGRWKRAIGEALHSQTDGRQTTDVVGRRTTFVSYEMRRLGITVSFELIHATRSLLAQGGQQPFGNLQIRRIGAL